MNAEPPARAWSRTARNLDTSLPVVSPSSGARPMSSSSTAYNGWPAIRAAAPNRRRAIGLEALTAAVNAAP